MVAALIQFSQGVTTPPAGEAMLGAGGAAVNASNSDNTGVQSWTFELVDIPPSSTVSPTLQGPSGLSSFAFTPDVAGSYRLQLIVADANGNTDTDIRVFSVPEATTGFVLPPWQGTPDPLPLTGPTAKPEEMNFGGQARGWMGDNDTSRKLLHQQLQALSLLQVSFDSLRIIKSWSNQTGSFAAQAFIGYRLGALSADCTITLPASPVLDDLISIAAPLDLSLHDCVVDGNGKTINDASTLSLSAGETLEISYDGTQWRIV